MVNFAILECLNTLDFTLKLYFFDSTNEINFLWKVKSFESYRLLGS